MDQQYERQIALPEVGKVGQRRIQQASVLIVGMGGLGCPAAHYLAAAGVGRIGLIDADSVELPNLARQTLYSASDLGKAKVHAAKQRLMLMYPSTNIMSYECFLAANNIDTIASSYCIILDATDQVQTRYLLSHYCGQTGKAHVYGAVQSWESQLSVFNVSRDNGRTTSYAQLFPQAQSTCQTCKDSGVLGMVPGTLGTLQALEVIKLLIGMSSKAHSHLLLFDWRTHTQRALRLSLTDICQAYIVPKAAEGIPLITWTEVQTLLMSKNPPQLIDVREHNEPVEGHLGGWWIPLSEIMQSYPDLPIDRPVILYCRAGVRSQQAAKYLQSIFTQADLRCLNQTNSVSS